MQETTYPKQLLSHMAFVKRYSEQLESLGEWWQKITLIGKINSQNVSASLLDDMEGTRVKFKGLQGRLVENLIRENFRKTEREMSARAQVAIDILIRNLFERTADVGFLATDTDLRRFLQNDHPTHEEYETTVERLREYTAKYSVYDEIIVTDPQGNVRVHLDQNNPVRKSADPLLKQTLDTREAYVETFRYSDLQPHKRHALIYSCRIHEHNDPKSMVLGILCLCFRFQDEMQSIFANLARRGEWLTILDKQKQVIASSNEKRIAIGTSLATDTAHGARFTTHENVDYLTKTARTNGYQGYFGSGWQGHIMIPLNHAFAEEQAQGDMDIKQLQSSTFFPQELRSIRQTATIVNDDLVLMVLNGQIISSRNHATEFMPILDEVRSIGDNTRAVFDNSITNLYNTVISSLLSDVQFQASLAVDIMDRNLYERANDVRWWALTSRFREILAQPDSIATHRDELNAILKYINELYTVYTNLLIYDTRGIIVAVSNPQEIHHIGQAIGKPEFIHAVLSLRDSQRYQVTPFHQTSLYGDRFTYEYHTSITALENPSHVVGGIGIVFDSQPQFKAMLGDALPRGEHGQVLDGCFGVFVESSGLVISSTTERFPPGSTLELDERFVQLKNGERCSVIIELDELTYAVGAAMSKGYREYKTTGDYENDILGLVFVAV